MGFNIVVSNGEHGLVSPNGTVVVVSGEDQAFDIVAYAGFVIGNVIVDNISVGATSRYVFTNVLANHTIFASFVVQAFTPAQFRLDFPEFANITKYPDSQLYFWAGYMQTVMDAARWGNRLGYGLSLGVAHFATIAAQNAAQGAAGYTPGVIAGVVSSQSAGPISESIDTQVTAEIDGGSWNATVYGSMYLRLARQVGIGGFVAI